MISSIRIGWLRFSKVLVEIVCMCVFIEVKVYVDVCFEKKSRIQNVQKYLRKKYLRKIDRNEYGGFCRLQRLVV